MFLHWGPNSAVDMFDHSGSQRYLNSSVGGVRDRDRPHDYRGVNHRKDRWPGGGSRAGRPAITVPAGSGPGNFAGMLERRSSKVRGQARWGGSSLPPRNGVEGVLPRGGSLDEMLFSRASHRRPSRPRAGLPFSGIDRRASQG
jgi:hypothetical protein